MCLQATSLRGSMAIATMTANSPFPPGGFGHAYPGSDNDLRVEKALQADNVDNPCLRIVTFWPRKSCPYGCQSPHVNRAQTVSREEALAQLNDFVTQNGRSPMAADDVSCVPGTMPGMNTATDLCAHFGSVKDVMVDGYLVDLDHPIDYITKCVVPHNPRHPKTNPTGCWMGLDWHGPTSGGHRPSSASLSHHDFACVSCRPNDDSGWKAANHIGAKVLAMDYESRKVVLQSAGYSTSILLKQELEQSMPTPVADSENMQEKLRWQRYAIASGRDVAGSSFADCPLCAENMPLARMQFHISTKHPYDGDHLRDKLRWLRYTGMSNRDTTGSSFADCPLCAKNMPLACMQFHISTEHPEV